MKNALIVLSLIFSAQALADVAPPWQLPGLNDNKPVSLQQLQGQIVVMDFWASWCVPCRPAMKALSQLQLEYADAPVRFVPISVDEDADDAKDFIERYGPSLHSLHDQEGQVAESYDLLGMPSSFIVGPDGELVLSHQGFRKGDEALWRNTIDELLARMQTPAAA
ncbi:MAG: TlpA family protein disulfide reductase [Oceanococcus sp.]